MSAFHDLGQKLRFHATLRFYWITFSAAFFCHFPSALSMDQQLMHGGFIRNFMIKYYKRLSGDISQASLEMVYDAYLGHIWQFRSIAPWVIALISPLVLDRYNENFGRKPGLYIWVNLVNLLASVLALISYPCWVFEFFILSELLFGLTIGVSGGMTLLYLSETVPSHLRGRAGAIVSFSIVTAIVLSRIANLFSNSYFFYAMHGTCALFSLLGLLAYPTVPESIKYLLLVKKNAEKASYHLKTLFPTSAGKKVIADQIIGYRRELPQGPEINECRPITLDQIWKTPNLKVGLLVGINSVILRQVCSADFLLGHEYASLAFGDIIRGYNKDYFLIGTVVFCWILSVSITFFIEKISRRKLFIFSTALLIVLNYLVQINNAYYRQFRRTLFIQICAIVHFAIGPVYVLNLIHAEILLVLEIVPQVARSKVLCTVLFVDGLTKLFYYGIVDHFLDINQFFGIIVYASMAVPNVLMWMWLYLVIPETTGRLVSDIVDPWVVYDNKVEWKYHHYFMNTHEL